MTAHPGLLVAPPPLAGPSEDTPNRTANFDAGPAESTANTGSDQQTTLNGVAAENALPKPALANESDKVCSTQDQTEPAKFKDFIGQTMDLAFGPKYEKSSLDFNSYGKELVRQNILPALEFSDSATLNISLNNSKSGHAQNMLNHLNQRYFAAKSEA